ncbi:MAG: PH domain-containing protein [Candidatus Gracilibacteria bacterium]
MLLHWLSHKYFIDYADKKLIERKGFFSTKEKLFDLKNIREIQINQGLFGKLFHYGDILLSASASGGYQETICLKKIQNPRESMEILKSCI